MLQIKQLNYSENFVINTAQQKQLYGGGIFGFNIITNDVEDDRERAEVWQSYAKGEANITNVTDSAIRFDYENSSEPTLMLID